MNKKESKFGFVAIVGLPNVGKSSLLNSFLGQKISIVSPKPQTTRNKIIGILTKETVQLAFIDTPGMHMPKSRLGLCMENSINESISSVDTVLLVVQAHTDLESKELELIDRLKKASVPVIVAVNKIDLLPDKSALLGFIDKLSKTANFDAIVTISVKNNSGVTDLLLALEKHTTPGPHLFDEDSITDQPERVLVSEIIREKILKNTDKEVPHGIFVEIEKMKERKNIDITDIDATIYCEKLSHKGIIIGKSGTMLKKIGESARHDIENFFGTKVNLQIWVKVKEGWRNNSKTLRSFGYTLQNK